MAQIDKITQSSAANSEETASASEEMNAQANDLHDIVGVLSSMVWRARPWASAEGLAGRWPYGQPP